MWCWQLKRPKMAISFASILIKSRNFNLGQVKGDVGNFMGHFLEGVHLFPPVHFPATAPPPPEGYGDLPNWPRENFNQKRRHKNCRNCFLPLEMCWDLMCLEQLPFGAVLWTAGVCIDYKGVIFMTQAPEVRWSRAMQFGVGCSVALQHLPVRMKLGTGLSGRHPVWR